MKQDTASSGLHRSSSTREKPQLVRRLGPFDTVFLVIGSIIGSGIFMTTGFIAESVPSPGLILLVWLVGGLITLCGALTFAELGAMFPSAGGQYLYIREAYGLRAGFLYGWLFFWFIMGGGIAALAVGFAEYLGYFFPALSTQAYLAEWDLGGVHYSLSAGQIVAVAAIGTLSAVNYFGIKSGILVQNLFTFLRLFLVAALIIFGLVLGEKVGITRLDQLFCGGPGLEGNTFRLFGVALIAVFWTYDGWYSANCTAEEIRNPQRNIPLGLLLGTLSVTVIYCLMNLLYVMTVPVEEMKGVFRIGELVSTQLFGPSVTFFVSAGIMLSVLGCLSATILFGPRVFYAMAEDRCFFRAMSYVHPRYHVPSVAIVGQGFWAALLCLSGTYQQLYEFVVFALVIFFAATGFAVIILRYRQPDKERPYKAWGYPFLPLLFVLMNLAIFVNIVLAQPIRSLIGLLFLSISLPAFAYWKRHSGP